MRPGGGFVKRGGRGGAWRIGAPFPSPRRPGRPEGEPGPACSPLGRRRRPGSRSARAGGRSRVCGAALRAAPRTGWRMILIDS